MRAIVHWSVVNATAALNQFIADRSVLASIIDLRVLAFVI